MTLLEDLQWVGARSKLCMERGDWLRRPPPAGPEPVDCNDCMHCEWNARLGRLHVAAARLREEIGRAEEGAASRNACAEFGTLPALLRINGGPVKP